MIVEAERADGALMVTDGPAAAVVLPNGMVTYLAKDSVYARGGWLPATRGDVPKSVDPQRLAEVRARAETTVVANEEPPTDSMSAVPAETSDEAGVDGVDEGWDAIFAEAIQAFLASDVNLREYWIHGEGAAKIRWGTGGDFTRCVRHLRKYVRDPEGLCAEYHKTATGMWPGDRDNTAAAVDEEATMDTIPAVEAPIVEPMPVECPDGQHVDPDTGECVADEPVAVDAVFEHTAAQPGEHFHTWVTEGVSTGRRILMPGAVTWRDPPFAYHWMTKSSAHGGTAEVVQVGRIVRGERAGDTAHWWGQLDLRDPLAVEHGRKIVEGWIIGTSVGPDEHLHGIDVEVIWPEGVGLSDDEAGMFLPEPQEERYHAFPVGELTGVSLPALADARIEPTQDLVDALVELGVLTAPADDASPIIAAGYTIEIPDVPPAWWFDEPTDVTPHGALTVTDEGRLYGYVAPADVAHRSFPGKRVTAPMGHVDYSRWHKDNGALTASGAVTAGPITMECGHADPTMRPYDARREHYENTCAVVAAARVGENRHGVWVAGALLPGVTAEQVCRMMACRLSGDWQPHPERPGWQEFVAALLVPVPGFASSAQQQASVRVREGVLVASAVPVRFAHAGEDAAVQPDLRPALERVARSIHRDAGTRMAELHARVAARRGVDTNV